MITHYNEYNIIIVMNCKKIHSENIISENENEYIQQCHVIFVVCTTFSLILSNTLKTAQSNANRYHNMNIISVYRNLHKWREKKNEIKWRDKKNTWFSELILIYLDSISSSIYSSHLCHHFIFHHKIEYVF